MDQPAWIVNWNDAGIPGDGVCARWSSLICSKAGVVGRLLRQSHPQLLRRLFAAMGVHKSVFVPVMTGVQENGDEQARELLAVVAGTLGGIVTIVTLLVLGSGCC